jgi:hypothetical protein
MDAIFRTCGQEWLLIGAVLAGSKLTAAHGYIINDHACNVPVGYNAAGPKFYITPKKELIWIHANPVCD